MADKDRACKECGYLTNENACPACGSRQFALKFKGRVLVFTGEDSEIARKLSLKHNGRYALKFS